MGRWRLRRRRRRQPGERQTGLGTQHLRIFAEGDLDEQSRELGVDEGGGDRGRDTRGDLTAYLRPLHPVGIAGPGILAERVDPGLGGRAEAGRQHTHLRQQAPGRHAAIELGHELDQRREDLREGTVLGGLL